MSSKRRRRAGRGARRRRSSIYSISYCGGFFCKGWDSAGKSRAPAKGQGRWGRGEGGGAERREATQQEQAPAHNPKRRAGPSKQSAEDRPPATGEGGKGGEMSEGPCATGPVESGTERVRTGVAR